MKESPFKFTMKFLIFCFVLALITSILIFVVLYATEKMDTYDFETPASLSPKSTTVIIDAGHGGEDGGTSGENGIIEKDLNLQISFHLRDMLTAAGVNVIMTREEDILLYDRNVDFKGRKKSLDLRARLDVAERHPEAIFVSIHMNAFPSTKYKGLQVYYSKNKPNSKVLADEIQKLTKQLLQPENTRKTKAADSSIFLLNRAPSTAVLVECGFLSNVEESILLSDEKYRQRLAYTLFLSISEHIYENYG